MASNATNMTSWTPPAVKDLRLDRTESDCDVSAEWAAEYLKTLNIHLHPNGDHGDDADDAWEVMDIGPTIDMLRTTVPPGYYRKPTKHETVQWYLNDLIPKNLTDVEAPVSGFYWEMARITKQQCETQFCQNIHWPGDPEVMGPGVWASYCMEAILSTIFLVVIMMGSFAATCRVSSRWLAVLVKPFSNSVETFLDATLVFELAMLAAAFVRYVSIDFGYVDDDASLIPLFLSIYFSLFAAFPPMILFLISSPAPEEAPNYKRLRHDKGRMVRRVLWGCAVVLSVALMGLNNQFQITAYDEALLPSFGTSALQTMVTEQIWAYYCEDKNSRYMLKSVISFGLWFFIIYALGSLVYLCLHCIPFPWWKKFRNYSKGPIWRLCWQLFLSICCLAFMWYILVCGYIYRKNNNIRDGEGEWTFGQVLALATWAPVVITLLTTNLYVGKEKVKRGLSLHRPDVHRWRPKAQNEEEPVSAGDMQLDPPIPSLKRSQTK